MVVLLGVALLSFVLITRGTVNAHALTNGVQPVDRPIQFNLTREMGDFDVSLTPQADGSLEVHRGLFGTRKLTFVPNKPLKANTSYKLSFHQPRRVLLGSAEIPDVQFRTERAPALKQSFAKHGDTIAMDAKMTFSLASRAGHLRDLELRSEPALELVRQSRDDTTFSWKATQLLSPSTDYKLTLYDNVQNQKIQEMTVKSAAEPSIETPVKPDHVVPGDELVLKFRQAIDPKERQNIRFELEGNGEWRNDKEYAFKPTNLQPGQTYTYKLPKNMRSSEGGVLREEVVQQFRTNAQVEVVASSPRGNELPQSAQKISFSFDQPVDKQSAQQNFRISHGTVSGFSWRGNTMDVTVTNLGFQRTVAASVEVGVKPTWGLPSNRSFSLSFQTETRSVKLDVPYYRQVYAQSCEAASLRMALAYRGVQDSDWNILQKFGYNPRPRDKDKNEWDDPNQQFVGDVNGNQTAGTGWGVYAGPVRSAAAQYGRSSTLAYGANPGFVAQQIHAGNPVIVWGIWGSRTKIDSWTTPGGATISGPVPMHVRLVVGVKGEPDNPVGFYIHDAITGPTYWTYGQFIANTSAAGPGAQLLAIQ